MLDRDYTLWDAVEERQQEIMAYINNKEEKSEDELLDAIREHRILRDLLLMRKAEGAETVEDAYSMLDRWENFYRR